MNKIRKYTNHSFFKFFYYITFIVLISCKANTPSDNVTKTIIPPDSLTIEKDTQIVVSYFHTTFRCQSCTKLEQLTKESVEKNFSKNNKIIFKSLNIDKSDNKHFIKDYQLFTKSVVLSKIIKGKEAKWKRLDKIWELLHKPEQFEQYIVNEIITITKD